MVLFALVGMGLEVVFTALADPFKKQKLYVGYASVMYLPLYALTPYFLYITPPKWAWWHRGLWYVLVIYVLEGLLNAVLEAYYGTHPSRTSYLRGWNYHGLVNLEPLRIVTWFGAGLFIEWLWKT
jgi:hypothetical protein